MLNEEIINKAVRKAIKNGYKYDFNIEYNMQKDKWETTLVNFRQFEIRYIIFSHEFCKAFFGEEKINIKEVYKAELEQKGIEKIGCNSDNPWFDWEQNWTLEFPKWKMHLREMVLEENPLKYLEKFLEEK